MFHLFNKTCLNKNLMPKYTFSNNQKLSMMWYIQEGIRGVIVIGDTSSNPGLGWLYFTSR